MSNSLTYEVNGPVALLTLNRPDKLNAIDTAMMAEMNAAMDQAEEDHSIRAIVVKANGKSFSAGFDLDDEVWSSDKDEDIRAALQNSQRNRGTEFTLVNWTQTGQGNIALCRQTHTCPKDLRDGSYQSSR